jgi:Ni/Co efflux regulator RcnB/surface antigen
MKVIFTATILATLLGTPAVMAQPGDAGRDRGNKSENADRKNEKPNEADSNRATPPGGANGNPRALRGASPVVPAQAEHSRPQAAGDRAAPMARSSQPAPNLVAAPMQAPRTVAPVPPPGRSDRMTAQRPALSPQAQAPRIVTPAPPSAQPGRMTAQRPAPPPQNRNPIIMGNQAGPSPAGRWSRGDNLPNQYNQSQYYVNDWQQHGLRQPPGGYRWVRNDNNDFFLALIATGVIADVVARSDRDAMWRQHYSRTYSYNDDVYYQQCRTAPDPAGVLIGGLIGGLLGNAAGGGGNRTGATIAGVIFGGAVGAALTRNMDCEDRSYAYKSYYNGFNSGRTGQYEWRNPRNDHRGEFRVGSYYNDPYGFRCARFTQVTYIQGRSYSAKGVACRQPDGSWATVN